MKIRGATRRGIGHTFRTSRQGVLKIVKKLRNIEMSISA